MTGKKLQKLKQGTRLRVSKKYKEYWMNNAFSDCFSPNGAVKVKDALDFMIRKAIAIDLPHTVEFDHYRHDVGTGPKPLPGAYVKMSVGPFTDHCYLAARDLELVDK